MDALMQSGRVTLTIFTIFFKTAAFYMKSFDLTDKKKKKKAIKCTGTLNKI